MVKTLNVFGFMIDQDIIKNQAELAELFFSNGRVPRQTIQAIKQIIYELELISYDFIPKARIRDYVVNLQQSFYEHNVSSAQARQYFANAALRYRTHNKKLKKERKDLLESRLLKDDVLKLF